MFLLTLTRKLHSSTLQKCLVLPVSSSNIRLVRWTAVNETPLPALDTQEAYFNAISFQNSSALELVPQLEHLSNGGSVEAQRMAKMHPWRRAYHLEEEQLCHWNHVFWLEMNSKFSKSMQLYIEKIQQQQKQEHDETENERIEQSTMTDAASPVLDPEVMAIFYRQFLQENKPIFQRYHRQWWRRNWALLGSAAKASLSRFIS